MQIVKNSSRSLRKTLFGDRSFYSRVAMVAVPMIVQNTLSNVVGLLDNVMVGQIGTVPMSAVAIISQLLFVFYVCIWGSAAGAGIFGAQFFGSGDYDGVRHTLRFKLLMTLVLTAGACILFLTAGGRLIDLYIASDTAAQTALETRTLAMQYLRIMLVGLIPFTITQCYASTMREAGKTSLPMAAGMIAMVVNFIFNSLLIFGLLGFPKLGVAGAAIATVISRVVELAIVLTAGHRNHEKYGFLQGMYSDFSIPPELMRGIFMKAVPLFANEFLWSTAQAALLQCYSVRGISVVAAMNITFTISQIFNEVFLSLGNSTGILVGQELGADRKDSARLTAWRMITLSFLCCIVIGVLLFFCAPLIPRMYNTEAEIRLLAASLIRVSAVCMPICGVTNASYFTIRSGGNVIVTFFFDSFFTWTCVVTTAWCLVHLTAMNIVPVFFIVSSIEFIKAIIGLILVKRGIWVRNIVAHA